MTQALAGITVVVTRPAAQAASFAALLAGAGADAVLFPTIGIEPVGLDADARARLAPDGYDWAVYTSANAVECALRQSPPPARTRVAAIGRATASALEGRGVAVAAMPEDRADSEGLLALPAFQDVHGDRILVVKGVGGRTLLRDELTRRGATVTLAEVYQRVRAAPDAAALAELGRACASPRVVVAVTSVEVLDALLELAPDGQYPRLRDATLLVPGARVAASARSRGWRGPLLVARGAGDAEMLGALAGASATGGAAASA